jgi:predicted nucleotidyltransferase component of viral defense system
MSVPIINVLGRKDFVSLAELQDATTESLFELDPNLILHGGTAIWRCYDGNRFSYDLDLYMPSREEIKLIARNLTFAIRRRGVQLDKLNIIDRSLMGYVSDGLTRLKLDMEYPLKHISPIRKTYRRADGTLFNVRTLSPEDFIIEKIAAYSGRKYLRDLYDIYHLMNYITKPAKVRARLNIFLKSVDRPENDNDLETLIYSGVAPSFNEMIDYILGKIR